MTESYITNSVKGQHSADNDNLRIVRQPNRANPTQHSALIGVASCHSRCGALIRAEASNAKSHRRSAPATYRGSSLIRNAPPPLGPP